MPEEDITIRGEESERTYSDHAVNNPCNLRSPPRQQEINNRENKTRSTKYALQIQESNEKEESVRVAGTGAGTEKDAPVSIQHAGTVLQTQALSIHNTFLVLDCKEDELMMVPETQGMALENKDKNVKQNKEDSLAVQNRGSKGRNRAKSIHKRHNVSKNKCITQSVPTMLETNTKRANLDTVLARMAPSFSILSNSK